MSKITQPLFVCRVVPSDNSRLPSGYTEREYIQSNPNTPTSEDRPVIKTGLYLPDGFISESRIKIIDLNNGQAFMGVHNASAPYQRNHHSMDGGYFEPANGGDSYFHSTIPVPLNTIFTYYCDNTLSGTPIAKLNGEDLTLISKSGSVGTRCGDEIYLMGTNTGNGRSSGCGGAVLYETKIWDKNHTLLRHYIPCTRDNDGETGMYDIANNKFYLHSGNYNFLYGEATTEKELKPVLVARVAYKDRGLLPSGYTEVAEIQCPYDRDTEQTSAGIIFTDVIPNANTGIKFKIKNLNVYNNDFNFIGCRTDNGARFMVNCYTKNGIYNLSYGYGDYSGQISCPITQTGTYEIEFNYNNDREFVVDGTKIKNITETFGTPDSHIALFGQAYQNDSKIGSPCYKYTLVGDVIITNNTSEIRHYVPCIRDIDNVVGYYDLINDEFITNHYYQTYPLTEVYMKTIQPLFTKRVKEGV